MRKALYVLAALLTFAASNSTTRPRSSIKMVYQPEANGDYRLYLFGSDRTLVCEARDIRIVDQGDAIKPVILECKH